MELVCDVINSRRIFFSFFWTNYPLLLIQYLLICFIEIEKIELFTKEAVCFPSYRGDPGLDLVAVPYRGEFCIFLFAASCFSFYRGEKKKKLYSLYIY